MAEQLKQKSKSLTQLEHTLMPEECVALMFQAVKAPAGPERLAVLQALKAGAPINAPENETGNTVIMYAAWRGNADLVHDLIKLRADLNIQNKKGSTALMWAAFDERLDCIQHLLHGGADVDLKNSFGWTALTWAVSKKKPLACAALAAAGSDFKTPAPGDKSGKTGEAYIDYMLYECPVATYIRDGILLRRQAVFACLSYMHHNLIGHVLEYDQDIGKRAALELRDAVFEAQEQGQKASQTPRQGTQNASSSGKSDSLSNDASDEQKWDDFIAKKAGSAKKAAAAR
jgi:hypothetical protein